MKKFLLLLMAACLLFVLWMSRLMAKEKVMSSWSEPALPETVFHDGPSRPNQEHLAKKIAEASGFCLKNGLNTEVALMVDLGLNSGSYRFFVVRLTDGSIRMKGLVTHGSGKNGLLAGERLYSNKEGSLLSALGKYKTGIAYSGQFGLAYKLHGLDSSNSNAFKRAIVLHGHQCVPDAETEDPICQSWGCPTVSPDFLLQLQKIINATHTPVLLWLYDSAREE